MRYSYNFKSLKRSKDKNLGENKLYFNYNGKIYFQFLPIILLSKHSHGILTFPVFEAIIIGALLNTHYYCPAYF